MRYLIYKDSGQPSGLRRPVDSCELIGAIVLNADQDAKLLSKGSIYVTARTKPLPSSYDAIFSPQSTHALEPVKSDYVHIYFESMVEPRPSREVQHLFLDGSQASDPDIMAAVVLLTIESGQHHDTENAYE